MSPEVHHSTLSCPGSSSDQHPAWLTGPEAAKAQELDLGPTNAGESGGIQAKNQEKGLPPHQPGSVGFFYFLMKSGILFWEPSSFV